MPEPIATRAQAIEFLQGRVNYERSSGGRGAAGCFKLDRMRRLLDLLGNPQQRLPAVHIAGTKGKGSTAAMTAAMLTSAGYRTGLYTSPHLHDFEERMRVDGAAPDESELVALVNLVREAIGVLDETAEEMQPTYFEIATALAWLYFTRQAADAVVLEVGLGGRLDATNLCAPRVTLITSISYDHTVLLGSTLAEIAGEKAGIVKPGMPVISGVTQPEARAVVRETCRARNAPLYELDHEIRIGSRPVPTHRSETEALRRRQFVDVETPWRNWRQVELPLLGEHQARNAALALAAIDLLHTERRPVSPEAARDGLRQLAWPLRIEVLGERPAVIVDAAHNVASAVALAGTLEADFAAERRILIFAATRDKDFAGMLAELEPLFETIVLTRYAGNPRGVPVETLLPLLEERRGRGVMVADDPAAACDAALALARSGDLVCATGSFFLAAEAREILAPRLTPPACPQPAAECPTSRDVVGAIDDP